LNLKEWKFLPNYDYKQIQKIITSQNDVIKVLWDSFYQASKYLKEKKTGEYKYPVVHTITKDGLGIRYSNKNKGHFGVPKVLLNFNETQYSHYEQNDFEGKYGMSQITFGIHISSKKEGNLILKAINTLEFKEIIKATKWGAFQTDYRMFKYFKKDFWKEFVDDQSIKLTPQNIVSPTKKSKKKESKVPTDNNQNTTSEEFYYTKYIKKAKKKLTKKLGREPTNNEITKKAQKIAIKKKSKQRKYKYDYEGPHEGKFLKGSTKKFGKTKYNTLNNAKRNANTNNNVGGITQKKGKFEIRKGKELKDSPSGEVSWLKKLFN